MAEGTTNQAKEEYGRSGQDRKIRVLLTKSRMDAHDRGIRDVAKELSNAGMEVVFTRYALPEEIVKTAIQEGSDVIGVSCSTGGHLYVTERIQDCLEKEGIKEIKVIFGGIIPDVDVPKMKERGVVGIFGPGSSVQEIIRAITE